MFLAGLVLQLASFSTFTCIYLLFLHRVYKFHQEVWVIDRDKAWYRDWRALAGALLVSCVGIMVGTPLLRSSER